MPTGSGVDGSWSWAACCWWPPAIAFASTDWLPILSSPATSGSSRRPGNEVGPFLAVEQAALSEVVPDRAPDGDLRLVQPRRLRRDGDRRPGRRPRQRGAASTAGWADVDAYRAVVVGYAAIGGRDGAHRGSARKRGRGTVGPRRRTTASRGASACAGRAASSCGCPRCSRSMRSAAASSPEPDGLLVPPAVRGRARGPRRRSSSRRTCSPRCRRCRPPGIAARIGLINTMVFTHLPSNVLLMLVPLMPNLRARRRGPAGAVQPQPDGRADAAVLHDGGRRPGRALGGGRHDRHRPDDRAPPSRRRSRRVLFAVPALAAVPFFLAGGLKIAYDLLLWRQFRDHAPAEDAASGPESAGRGLARPRDAA